VKIYPPVSLNITQVSLNNPPVSLNITQVNLNNPPVRLFTRLALNDENGNMIQLKSL